MTVDNIVPTVLAVIFVALLWVVEFRGWKRSTTFGFRQSRKIGKKFNCSYTTIRRIEHNVMRRLGVRNDN